jgi:hypothetical protein
VFLNQYFRNFSARKTWTSPHGLSLN